MNDRRAGRRWPALAAALATLATPLAACESGGGAAERADEPADQVTVSTSGGPARDETVPADARIVVLFGLRRDDDGLALAVQERSDPGSAAYLDALTIEEIAARFGATEADREQVLGVVRAAGAAAHVTADGGAVVASMTAEQVHDVLGQWPQASVGPDGALVVAATRRLVVPAELAGVVTEVAGARSTATAGEAPAVPGVEVMPTCGASPADGVAERSALGEWYGFDDYLYRDGIRGAGRRVGVLAIGRWEPAALDAMSACYGTRPSGDVEVVPAPGAPEVAVGPEVTLDVVVASSFAPEAHIDVVQYDRYGSVASGFLAAIDRSTTAGPYDALSTSIGYCEGELEADEVALTEHALLVLAAMGTTVLASSGDTGAAGCYPDTRAAVQYPASSPWVTGVGGTSLRLGVDGGVAAEEVWSSSTVGTPLAGGGGSSELFARPWYQDDLEPAGAVPGRRLVPDVAFLADPSIVPPIPICAGPDDCSWYRLGGTSAPAPALAAAIALVDQDLSDRTGSTGDDVRLGLLTPLARQLALGGEGGHDVTQGGNAVLGLPCCAATPGYDLSSGWGSLRLPALADLAASRTAP